jgi:hypothetical protein
MASFVLSEEDCSCDKKTVWCVQPITENICALNSTDLSTREILSPKSTLNVKDIVALENMCPVL